MYIEIEICHKLLGHAAQWKGGNLPPHHSDSAAATVVKTYTDPAKLSGLEQARMLDSASS